MTLRLLTKHYLKFLSLTGACTGSSESIRVKMPHCSRSRVTAHCDSVTVYIQKYYRGNMILGI